MSGAGPRTPDADAAREAAAAGEGQAAGGVRRLTDADAKGRRGKRPNDDAAALPPSRSVIQNAGIVVGAFAGGTVVAEVAGATNLGTALSFGQIGFAIALVFVLVRR